MKKITLLLVASLFIFGSCTEEIIEIDEVNFMDNSFEIVSCHEEQNWTKDDLEKAARGKWEYAIGWCGWTGLITPDFEKQTIKLKRNGTAIIKTDDDEVETNWQVLSNPNGFLINIETLGNFFICGDKMTTYTSVVDGCDLTFSK